MFLVSKEEPWVSRISVLARSSPFFLCVLSQHASLSGNLPHSRRVTRPRYDDSWKTAESLLLAEVVEKVEISDDQYFCQKPTSPKIATVFLVYAIQDFTQREIDLMAVPPAKISKCSPMRLKFLNQLQKETFSTASAISSTENTI